MIIDRVFANAMLDHLIELLDVPPSYYEKAIERYQSLGEWFHRPDSALRRFAPAVSLQGSFRYGTVIRPLLPTEEFDLDLVALLLELAKSGITQADLKELVGKEIKAYAKQHGMADPKEKRRCWRLDYVDRINFHMDCCPGLPEDEDVKCRLRLALEVAGVDGALADLAIAITCQDHADYRRISLNWPGSNPEGLARWFEMRMRLEGLTRARALVESRVYASIDDVPVYQWKTPLQRAVQLLKRHRDVMFREHPEVRPISMIITTLAAHAYDGESDLVGAVDGILGRMLNHVHPRVPRVASPVNPVEDFADKWAHDPRVEQNFRLWHQQATSDFKVLTTLDSPDRLQRFATSTFGANVTERRAMEILATGSRGSSGPTIIVPSVSITSAPRPWGYR